MSPRAIMIGASTRKFTPVPSTTLVATRIPIKPADPEHGGIKSESQAQRAEFCPEDLRNPELVLRREHVVIIIETFMQMPRLGPRQKAIEPEQLN